jgi:hypothetical protein
VGGEVGSQFTLRGATGIGLALPPNLSFGEWQAIGARLGAAETSLNWAIGDWFRAGLSLFGIERLAGLESWGRNGLSYEHAQDLARVARAFQVPRRRGILPFSCHREVAGLDPADADRLLDWCVADPTDIKSTRELREKVQDLKEERELEERRQHEEAKQAESRRRAAEQSPAGQDGQGSAEILPLTTPKKKDASAPSPAGKEERQDSEPRGRVGNIVSYDELRDQGWVRLWEGTKTITHLKVSAYSAARRRPHDISAVEAIDEFDKAIRRLQEARRAIILRDP